MPIHVARTSDSQIVVLPLSDGATEVGAGGSFLVRMGVMPVAPIVAVHYEPTLGEDPREVLGKRGERLGIGTTRLGDADLPATADRNDETKTLYLGDIDDHRTRRRLGSLQVDGLQDALGERGRMGCLWLSKRSWCGSRGRARGGSTKAHRRVGRTNIGDDGRLRLCAHIRRSYCDAP